MYRMIEKNLVPELSYDGYEFLRNLNEEVNSKADVNEVNSSLGQINALIENLKHIIENYPRQYAGDFSDVYEKIAQVDKSIITSSLTARMDAIQEYIESMEQNMATLNGKFHAAMKNINDYMTMDNNRYTALEARVTALEAFHP